jgi:hypothetical protein
MTPFVAFLIGMVVGGCFAFVLFGILSAGKRADEAESEHWDV